jgi:hypothetical protein
VVVVVGRTVVEVVVVVERVVGVGHRSTASSPGSDVISPPSESTTIEKNVIVPGTVKAPKVVT